MPGAESGKKPEWNLLQRFAVYYYAMSINEINRVLSKKDPIPQPQDQADGT